MRGSTPNWSKELATRGRLKMAKIDFDEIRRHFPLPVYCEARGIRLKRSGRFLIGKCPIHQERNGEAFTIDPEAQRWRCRGKCSRGGDVIDLEQALGGGTPMEATARLIVGTSSWEAPAQSRSEQKPRSTSEWSWRERNKRSVTKSCSRRRNGESSIRDS